MKKHVLIIVAYSPKIYSGLDRNFVALSCKLVEKGYSPVFVYGETTDAVTQIVEDLEREGAIVEHIPDSGKWRQYSKLRNLYSKYKPELVHTHFVNYLRILSALMSRVRGIRHFTTIHSMISRYSIDEYIKKKGRIKRWLLGIYFMLLCLWSKNVFCVSKNIERELHKWAYGGSSNAVTLYLGIDTTPSERTKEEVRKQLHLPQDKILLVNISAKEYLKGIDLMLKAMAELKSRGYDNVMFVHIGGLRADNDFNRRYEQELYDLAKKLKVDNDVVWLGKRMDIKDIMPAFDIYVHPSREEGLPTVLIEASAASLPLIGTDVGGIPEIVINDENGLLFEKDDDIQLADKIIMLLDDENLRHRFASEAYKIVGRNFEMERQVGKLFDYYDLG